VLNKNAKSLLADCAFVTIIALATATHSVLADSSKPLPEVIEKESARMREVVIPGAPHKTGGSAISTQSKIDASKNNASTPKSSVAQYNSGQELFSDESAVEVRGILEQVSKEKETLPGVISSGGPVGMPQAQPMYQPEGQ